MPLNDDTGPILTPRQAASQLEGWGLQPKDYDRVRHTFSHLGRALIITAESEGPQNVGNLYDQLRKEEGSPPLTDANRGWLKKQL